ncbi:MAG: hydrogen peroxide-dependent heme synthase [Planctomycetota bacterium]|jgi:chlorite dismutase|nr:heme-dependent peroxidase [Planctomycetota bacterium]
MTHPPAQANLPEPSVIPVQGWHCGHYFYRWDRRELATIGTSELADAKQAFCDGLNDLNDRPERMQSFIISGHKADLGLVMMDPDPLKIDRVHQRLLATKLGRALMPTYSFVSMSEISEYLPSKEQYAQKLIKGGEDPSSSAFGAKVASYERRIPIMHAQRLAPEFPNWPAMCFYPMNKSRNVGANWFLEPFSIRTEMMAEHAQSGMAFAGRVTQLVTASAGLDDWEWGVTLWARNPQFLKDIVYTMRFDKASATFGEFGEFYVGYLASPQEILKHCCIGS